MRKLRLDDLAVESFATEGASASQVGTVRGHDSGENTCWTCNLTDDDYTCATNCGTQAPQQSCWNTCVPGGGTSCGYTGCLCTEAGGGGGGTGYGDATCGVPCATNNCVPT